MVSRNRGRRGATMVEFALGFMLLLLLVVGLIEMGRGVWTYTTIAHAARQGARYAMAHGKENPATTTQIRDYVRSHAVGLNPANVEVTTTYPSGVTRGGTVVVQVRYPFQIVTGGLIVKDPFTIGANSRTILAN